MLMFHKILQHQACGVVGSLLIAWLQISYRVGHWQIFYNRLIQSNGIQAFRQIEYIEMGKTTFATTKRVFWALSTSKMRLRLGLCLNSTGGASGLGKW